MAKYTKDFKLNVVKAYLRGEGGYKTIAKNFNTPAVSNVEDWIKMYSYYGEKGLERKKIYG